MRTCLKCGTEFEDRSADGPGITATLASPHQGVATGYSRDAGRSWATAGALR